MHNAGLWTVYAVPGSGVGATSLGKAEDAVHTSGDVGIMALGVRNDNAGTTQAANGDYIPFALDNAGRLHINGQIAHDGAVGSAPVYIAGVATNAAPTDVSAVGDVARVAVGLDGVLFIRERPRTPWSVTHAPAAATQATISQASAGAGLKNVMRGFMVTVVASGAATAETVIVNIRDGATGAGTILWSAAIEVPTLAGAGSVPGSPFGMSDIYLVGTAATAMTIETSAAPGANIVARVNAWGEVSA